MIKYPYTTWSGVTATALRYGNGYWVATYQDTLKYASTKGGSMTTVTWPLTTNWAEDLWYGSDGYWVLVSGSGTIAYATDPTGTWSVVSSPPFGGSPIYAVMHDGTYWVAAGGAGKLATATTPSGTWTLRTFPVSDNIYHLCYANGYWVASTASGLVTATNPTSTWTDNTSFPAGSCGSVAWTGSEFIAIEANGAIYYATTPTGSWTLAQQPVLTGYSYVCASGDDVLVYRTFNELHNDTDPTGAYYFVRDSPALGPKVTFAGTDVVMAHGPTVLYSEILGSQIAVPDADTDASGWTTTPLWSKVDEGLVADGTVVSETSA